METRNQSGARSFVLIIFFFGVVFQGRLSRADSAAQVISLDGSAPGKVFEGVGAVSGGGATSVLLKDYPEPQRSQILDILFKPGFAASMQTLYVEVGGDGNSTQGTEPTHMRSRTEENYSRGYEWWIMVEAKKRNPALTLDACAWSAPGWIGDGEFWSQDMADYYVKWIKGLKANYGIDLDAVGGRNERGAVTSWMKLFRRTLDANGLRNLRTHGFDNPGNRFMWDWIPQLNRDKELVDAVNVVSNHTLTLGTWPASVRETVERLGKPVWNTEEHVYNGEGRFYKDDFDCALGAVHLFNENFISHGATKIVNWYLVGSIYPIEPYGDQPPAMIARSPWSGHYELKPIIWSYAHYGQFTHIGWKYVNSGCLALTGGGTVVTLKSDTGDWSVIAETAAAHSPRQVTFRAGTGLLSHSLCVWRTTREAQFEREPDVSPAADGTFTMTFEPGAIYSVSTTTGQQKGMFANVPEEKAFPFPYFENFKHYSEPKRFGYLPHYTADICGVFEIADRPDGRGKCLRQVVSRKAQSWAPEWMPYTVIGDSKWTDYEVSADIFFQSGGWAGVMGRVNNTGNGWDGNPNGYYARLYPDGGCALYVASDRYKGSREREIAIGEAKSRWRWTRWHNLKLRFEGKKITVLVDNVAAIVAEDDLYGRGTAGLITAGEGSGRDTACFDNLLINRVNGGAVSPTVFGQDGTPIYQP
jgi:galactosylceramidase